MFTCSAVQNGWAAAEVSSIIMQTLFPLCTLSNGCYKTHLSEQSPHWEKLSVKAYQNPAFRLTLVTATLAPLLISCTTFSAWPLCDATRRRSESARTDAASCWLMKQRWAVTNLTHLQKVKIEQGGTGDVGAMERACPQLGPADRWTGNTWGKNVRVCVWKEVENRKSVRAIKWGDTVVAVGLICGFLNSFNI